MGLIPKIIKALLPKDGDTSITTTGSIGRESAAASGNGKAVAQSVNAPVSLSASAPNGTVHQTNVGNAGGDVVINNNNTTVIEKAKPEPEPLKIVAVNLEDLGAEVAKLPLLQRKAMRKKINSRFTGVVATWQTTLNDAEERADGEVDLTLFEVESRKYIRCVVSLKDYPELSSLFENTPIKITGIIQSVFPLEIKMPALGIGGKEPEFKPALPPVKQERIFLNLSAAELKASIAGKTSVQQEVVVNACRGKWIEEEVLFNDYKPEEENLRVVFDDLSKRNLIWGVFENRWLDHFTHRPIGEKLKIRGKVKYFDSLGIRLVDCELVP